MKFGERDPEFAQDAPPVAAFHSFAPSMAFATYLTRPNPELR
jgi:hypothetical protein